MNTARYEVGDAEPTLVAAPIGSAALGATGGSVGIRNLGDGDDDLDIYVGGPDVTAGTGYPIAVGERYELDHLFMPDEVWVIAGEGVTNTVAVIVGGAAQLGPA